MRIRILARLILAFEKERYRLPTKKELQMLKEEANKQYGEWGRKKRKRNAN